MDGICEASNTLFKEFHNRENGGVFNVNNKNVVLNIKCSFFINNSVTEKGGCIYCSECKFNADMCSFFHCASFKHTDNYQGNIACTSNTDVHINNVNSLLCGYSELESSDSSFGLGNALFIIEYMNSSHNYGFGGGSGYSYSFCKENSYAKYTNILNGKDHHMIEAVYCEYNVYSSNFINCSELNAGIIYQSNDYSITFIDCSINPSDFERVSGRGSVITDNWTPESTFVIEYVGYNTAFCIGAVDRTSTPTPMTPTPETPTPNTPTPNTPTPNTPTPNTPTPKTVTPIIKTPNTVTPNTPTPKTVTPIIKTPNTLQIFQILQILQKPKHQIHLKRKHQLTKNHLLIIHLIQIKLIQTIIIMKKNQIVLF